MRGETGGEQEEERERQNVTLSTAAREPDPEGQVDTCGIGQQQENEAHCNRHLLLRTAAACSTWNSLLCHVTIYSLPIPSSFSIVCRLSGTPFIKHIRVHIYVYLSVSNTK